MKFLKLFFLGLVAVIFTLVLGFFIFIRTFDFSKYQDRIVKEIAKAVGREVGLDKMSLNLTVKGGLSLDVKGFSLSDNPRFSKEYFFTVKDIRLGVDVGALLFKKEIHISKLELNSPHIRIIRAGEGVINVQTLTVSSANESRKIPQSQSDQNKPGQTLAQPPSTADSLPFSLFIQSIQINDGVVEFVDNAFSPPLAVKILKINLTINDFSLADASDFSLEAAIFSIRSNFKAKGKIEISPETQALSFKKVEITSDLSDISLVQLEESFPMLKAAGLKEDFEGWLRAYIEKLEINKRGLAGLLMDLQLSEGQLDLSALPHPLSPITIDADVTEKDVRVKKIALPIASGIIEAKGNIKDYLKGQDFHFDASFKDIDLTQLIANQLGGVELQGKLVGQFAFDGKGLAPESLLTTLEGKGYLEILGGKLMNINILELVLSKISMIPDLVDTLKENLPEKYKEKLKEKDTLFSKLRFDNSLQNKDLVIDNAQIETDTFNISGRGHMTFDQRLSLEADIRVPSDLSQSMAVSVPALEYLRDETGEISIPLTISGKIPALSYIPDLEYLGKKILMTKGKEELNKVLDKVFGREDEASSPAETTKPSPKETTPAPEEKQEKRPEQELIEGILDQIFKK